MSKIRIIFTIVFIALANNGYGQTCCTGGVPILDAFFIPSASKGQVGTHLFYSFNNNNDLIFGDEVIDNSHISRKVSSAILQVDYALSDHWGVSLSIPYLWQKEEVDVSNNAVSYTNSGVGDMSLWLTYTRSFNSLNLKSAVSLKTPTGSTNKEADNNLVFPISMQTGSGSYDIAFIIQSSWYLDTEKKLSLENQISGRFNGSGTNFDAHPNYQFGNQYSTYLGTGYHFLLLSLVTDVFLGVSYQFRTQDVFDGGFQNTNTGGHWVNTGLGMNFFITPKIFYSVSVNLPVYRRLNGLQLSTTSQINTSINMRL